MYSQQRTGNLKKESMSIDSPDFPRAAPARPGPQGLSFVWKWGVALLPSAYTTASIKADDMAVIVADGWPNIYLERSSSWMNRSTSNASTPPAIAAVGNCERDLRWTTINRPDRLARARRSDTEGK
jgi:hypothetical protein